jgi:aminobenzoyl-glutamate transport protein
MAQELDSGGGKSGGGGGVLGVIEWLGNKLPDPVFLFLGATALVFVLSAIGSGLGWSVQPQRPRVVTEPIVENGVEVARPKKDAQGKPVIELVSEGAPVTPRNMLSSDGAYWLAVNMIRNFINFPPLGVVLVGMFGIGVAERVGLFSAILRWMARLVPGWALTPMIVFLGVMSNIASDAGYLVLPPLAAGLYILFKRPPLAGSRRRSRVFRRGSARIFWSVRPMRWSGGSPRPGRESWSRGTPCWRPPTGGSWPDPRFC